MFKGVLQIIKVYTIKTTEMVTNVEFRFYIIDRKHLGKEYNNKGENQNYIFNCKIATLINKTIAFVSYVTYTAK